MNNTTTHTFTNQRDAERFARAQGGPIDINIEHASRGVWIVTISSK